MIKKIENLFLLFFSIVVVSCRDDSGPYQEQFVSYDIVQFVDQSNEGGTEFSFYLPDNMNEMIYITSGAVIDTTKVKPGERLLLGYIPETIPHVSGHIKATGYSPIHNDALRVSERGLENEMPDWKRDGIYLYSIWRMGPFINLHGKTVYSTDGRQFMILIDRSDVDDKNPAPVLRIVNRMINPVDNFQREFYASFDLTNLWAKEWIEGATVELNNTNLPNDKFYFENLQKE